MVKYKLTIEYTDGEAIRVKFDSLADCLIYIKEVLDSANEFADKITIVIE